MTREIPWIISMDDHVVEPPHVWQRWLPEKYRDRGPRIEYDTCGTVWDNGMQTMVKGGDGPTVQWWIYEDFAWTHNMLFSAAGYAQDEWWMGPIHYDQMRPGCYDVQARLADMDLNHIEAALCFPTYPRFCGQLFNERKDRELALACVRAYNDWMVEEWSGESGGRLVPLCLIPLWDPQLAAAEIRRNAARGVRALAFSEIPPALGLPSIHSGHWDPMFEACNETMTTVCMHIGSSSKMPTTSPDAPIAVTATLTFNNAMASLADYLFSGLFVKYPNLRVAYSEGQIGWLPYVLERADDVWETHDGWMHTRARVPEPPSTYYHDHVFGCFFRDNHGLKSIYEIGVNNVTYETDYPHTDTTWPHTMEYVEKVMAGIPDEVVYKILRGNALRMLSLDENLKVVN